MSTLKRCIDIIISLVAITILIIPWFIIYLLVKLSSPGDAIYFSDRVGLKNQIFKMAKFRTMYIEAPTIPTSLLPYPEEWITPIGKFLRKYSLDEIPQFWNILIGEMSLVGPRPALFNETDLIAKRTDAGVHEMVPGLTGWAQINGRDELSLDKKLQYDTDYMERQSTFLDLKIMFLTLAIVFHGKNVSH
jgi:O-antigen biosynthesis protein WbqP